MVWTRGDPESLELELYKSVPHCDEDGHPLAGLGEVATINGMVLGTTSELGNDMLATGRINGPRVKICAPIIEPRQPRHVQSRREAQDAGKAVCSRLENIVAKLTLQQKRPARAIQKPTD